jgi:hypothetical protein
MRFCASLTRKETHPPLPIRMPARPPACRSRPCSTAPTDLSLKSMLPQLLSDRVCVVRAVVAPCSRVLPLCAVREPVPLQAQVQQVEVRGQISRRWSLSDQTPGLAAAWRCRIRCATAAAAGQRGETRQPRVNDGRQAPARRLQRTGRGDDRAAVAGEERGRGTEAGAVQPWGIKMITGQGREVARVEGRGCLAPIVNEGRAFLQ